MPYLSAMTEKKKNDQLMHERDVTNRMLNIESTLGAGGSKNGQLMHERDVTKSDA